MRNEQARNRTKLNPTRGKESDVSFMFFLAAVLGVIQKNRKMF